MSHESQPHGEPVLITRTEAHKAVVVLFVGGYRGLIVHWSGKGNTPCKGPDACPRPLHAQKALWRGYAPVEVWSESRGLWTPSVLELTENAEEQLRGRRLRGEVWMFSRARVGVKRSPVVAEMLEQRDQAGVRPPWDVEGVLLRFFDVEALLLDVPNPRAPAVRLPAVEAAPPKLPDDMKAAPAPEQAPRERIKLREAFDREKKKKAPRGGLDVPSENGVE